MSTSLTFTQELVKAAVGGLAPVLALVIGGRFLLDWYDLRKKKLELELDRTAKERARDAELMLRRREQELDLTKFVRLKQYEAVQELYLILAAYMSLYRLINSGHIDLTSAYKRLELLRELAPLEGRVDSAILRIASEFSNKGTASELSKYLPDLRQACQLWVERTFKTESLYPSTLAGSATMFASNALLPRLPPSLQTGSMSALSRPNLQWMKPPLKAKSSALCGG